MYNDPNEPNQNVPQYPPSYPPPSYPPSGSQPYGQPQQYAQPPQGYPYAAPPMAPSTSGWAIASLVCAIINLGILAIIFGYVGRNEIKNSGGRITGDGLALAGLIIGWIEVGIGLAAAAFFIIITIIAAASSSVTNY